MVNAKVNVFIPSVEDLKVCLLGKIEDKLEGSLGKGACHCDCACWCMCAES